MFADETEGWIFTDEAHKWMNAVRRLHGSHFINPRARAVGGYEFGLFGFKEDTCADTYGQCAHGSDRNFIYIVHFNEIPHGQERNFL